LKRTFPAVQFVGTSHSPQVIGELQPDEIRLMHDNEFSQSALSFGMDSNWVVEVLTGGSKCNAEVKDRLARVFQLIQDHNLAEAEREALLLRGEIGNSDEVGLQYYRLQRIYSGEIELKEGGPEGVKSPTDVGTGRAKEEKAPLSEIIQVLNERFGTNFTDEDRFFFEQIREKATANEQVVKLRRANPFDKFQLGLRQLIEDLMVQRMTDNDKIVTRYMDDEEFTAQTTPATPPRHPAATESESGTPSGPRSGP
jgi:hypothetical protein